jgi:hypothetical protein
MCLDFVSMDGDTNMDRGTRGREHEIVAEELLIPKT